MSVIKISELNAIPSAPTSDDFLPLVDSASMTTYRATLAELAQALTQSQYAVGAGYSSASYYSTQSLYATQSLWATQSLTASSLNFVPNFATNATNSLSASAATDNLFHWTAPSASANASSSIMGYGDDGSGRDLTLSTNNVVRHRWAWDGRTYLNDSTGSHWLAGDDTESDFYGHKVSISPSGSVTASFFDAKGNPDDVNIGKYFCNGLAGQSGTFTQFDSGSGLWKLCQYEGGILVASSSTAVSPVSSNIVDTVAVGTIMAYGGTNIPNNWLECDGAALLTASYWDLFQAIVNTDASSAYGYVCDVYGNRNVAGLYFKMPDLRGEFMRGWDHGRGIDALRATASAQAASVGNHFHGVGNFDSPGNNDAYFIYRSWADGVSYNARWIPGDGSGGPAFTSIPGGLSAYPIATSNPVNASSGDARPRNVAVTYIIKYSNGVNFAASGSTLAGDVTGNTSATTVVALRGTSIDVTAPTDGQYLKYDAGTNKWTPASITGVSGVGRSYLIANPGTGWVSQGGTDLYIIHYNRHTNYRQLEKINMLTNVVTFQCTSSNVSWNWNGRSFVLPSGIPQLTGSNERAYLFTGDGLYDYPLATNNLRLISGTGGHYLDLPISVSFAASSGSRPTVFCLYGGYSAGTNGDYPTVRWRKHYWTPGGWTYVWASANLDLRTIQNATEFLKFYNDYPSFTGAGSNLLMWDYNYIKQRYYIMDTDTGYLHILSQTTGTPWTNWDGSSITYEKSLAVPSVDSSDWADADAEKIVVDYDPVTGDERGIIYTRRSNTALLGVVNYVNWPE